jgi:hypothetical protein
MFQVNLDVLGIILSIGLSFGGFYFANRITGFGATPAFLAVVTVVSILVCMIPKYGWWLSIIAIFLLLRMASKNGVILMMITSWIMMFVIAVGVSKIL